ncbi:MAG: hypothetical protein WD851_07325 [Pirellulales bacterium]
MENSPRRRDSYAVVAFWLAFFIMIWPTQAGALHVLVSLRRYDLAGLLVLGCLAIVAIPYMRSFRRHWSEPQMWSGRGYLIATTVILMWNLLVVCTMFILALTANV